MFRGLNGAVVGALVVLSAAGCARDRGGDDHTLPDRLTACELLQAREVEAALGGQVRDPDATGEASADVLAGRSGCAWATHDDQAAALMELVRTDDMSPSVRRTGFSATARFSAARSRHPAAAPVEIGDRGMWVEETATLYVLAARSYVVVEVAVREAARAKDVAMNLVTPALRRLSSDDRAD